jgi:hypothetical protein
MPLTMREFEDGVAYWRDSTRWPSDFHNAFYGRLADQDPHGRFTEAWWATFRRHLTVWKAIRPASPAALSANAVAAFPELRSAWNECCDPVVDREIDEVAWERVERFPAIVGPLKRTGPRKEPVRSPVFTAKFCHFLLPAVFPLVDGAVMGLPFGLSYRAHYLGVQREWAQTPVDTRRDLHAALTSRIGAPLTSGYPLTNKVIELCLIGRRHPRVANAPAAT